MVKEILALNGDTDKKQITLDGIAKATAQYFKLTVADLKSKCICKWSGNSNDLPLRIGLPTGKYDNAILNSFSIEKLFLSLKYVIAE